MVAEGDPPWGRPAVDPRGFHSPWAAADLARTAEVAAAEEVAEEAAAGRLEDQRWAGHRL